MQIMFKDKPATITAGKARADEKAESRLRRDEQYILRRAATPHLGVSPPEADKMYF
jgi:hypothetical protein